jgi:hypothetical protein
MLLNLWFKRQITTYWVVIVDRIVSFLKAISSSNIGWKFGTRIVSIFRAQCTCRALPTIHPSHYHVFVTQLCGDGREHQSSSVVCLTEVLVPSSLFCKLKLITKTKPIPVFLYIAKATRRCVKIFRNENLQVRSGWLLSSSLFTIRYLWLPFSLLRLIFFGPS